MVYVNIDDVDYIQRLERCSFRFMIDAAKDNLGMYWRLNVVPEQGMRATIYERLVAADSFEELAIWCDLHEIAFTDMCK